MAKYSVHAIFAAAGLAFTGSMTADAVAMATALQDGRSTALMEFVTKHPDSRFAPDALMMVAGNGKGNNGNGNGNTSPGNQGRNGNGKGNSGGSV